MDCYSVDFTLEAYGAADQEVWARTRGDGGLSEVQVTYLITKIKRKSWEYKIFHSTACQFEFLGWMQFNLLYHRQDIY